MIYPVVLQVIVKIVRKAQISFICVYTLTKLRNCHLDRIQIQPQIVGVINNIK